jgi:hypothetical protein
MNYATASKEELLQALIKSLENERRLIERLIKVMDEKEAIRRAGIEFGSASRTAGELDAYKRMFQIRRAA